MFGEYKMEKTKPVKKFSFGSVSASVWKNERKTKEGRSFVVYSVSVQRVYTDEKGKPANTSSLRKHDVEAAINCLQAAKDYLKSLEVIKVEALK